MPTNASDPLFRAALGPSFDGLPRVVRAIHLRGTAAYAGAVVVRRGEGWLSRLCCRVARLPPAQDGPIRVDIEASPQGEQWIRHFQGHIMRSHLDLDRGRLHERLGPVRFWFHLTAEHDRLVWTVERAALLAIPLPTALFREVIAIESVEHGRYTFDVAARLPWVGLLVHYQGWLEVG